MTNLPVPLYAFVIGEEKRSTKDSKRFFWQNTIKTVVGDIKSLMWNATVDAENDPKFPHVGDIIEITGFDDQVAERGNIVIQGYHRITKEEIPEHAEGILLFDKASKEEMDFALGLIGDSSFWNSESNHKFTMAVLSKLSAEKLNEAPAATKVHHNYKGGLIVHSAEVLSLCRAIVESPAFAKYGFINKDALYCAAILHDMGKVVTYSMNAIGVAESMPTERTIGHLFYGMSLVQSVFATGDIDVSKDFVDEVLHMIASHHGSIEWGSLKTVQSIEAGILSRMDYVSSRNGMLEKVLNETVKSGGVLQDNFRIYGDEYFHSTGMKQYVNAEKEAG